MSVIKTIEYRTADLQDDNRWEAFKVDFSGFTVEAFKNCYPSDIRKLRLLLRANGVWVLKDTHVTIAQSMYNTLTEQILSEWPEADVEQYLDSGKKFNSAWMQYLVRGVVVITQASSQLILLPRNASVALFSGPFLSTKHCAITYRDP